MANSKLFSAAGLLLIAIAAWAVYGRAVDAPFVFDDAVSVNNNPSITRLWPLWGDSKDGGPLNASKNYPTAGRPLANFSLAVNYYFGELNPRGYHLFNLIVHVLSAWLVMAIVRRTLCLDHFEGRFQKASGPLALIAALLWALHPLQTETVIYVTQRTELMVGFFYLATLYASLRYWGVVSPADRNTWLALAIAACLAGMACKEVMVTAPVIVMLYERTFIARSFRRALAQSWPLYVGFVVSWGLLLWLNHGAPRSDSAGFARAGQVGLPVYGWWFTQAKVLWMYLKLTVWPWPLAIHYEMPYLTTISDAWLWLVAAMLLGIGTLIFLWRNSAIGFVGAWVLLILSPTLVVPILSEVAAERRMYLPLAAMATLFVAGGYWLVQRTAPAPGPAAATGKATWQWSHALACVVALSVVLVLSVISIRRLGAYQSAVSLWEENLAYQPDDPLAHNMLGNALLRTGRAGEAVDQYRRALQLRPDNSDAYANLGAALMSVGRPEEAIEQYEQALRLKPKNLDALANLALAYAAMNRPADAIAAAEKAAQMARSQEETVLAETVEAWLRTYRAGQVPQQDEVFQSTGAGITP